MQSWKALQSAAVAISLGAVPAAAQAPFDPGCPLPFAALALDGLAIDAGCGHEGTTNSNKHRLQNRAKNHFCAPGPAAMVTFFSFRRLQAAFDQTQPDLNQTRDGLKNLHTTHQGKVIGEGSQVKLAAFVMKADHASKETVNCNLGGNANHDIHIHLAKTLDEENLCETVVAEISPHFRPEKWIPDSLFIPRPCGSPDTPSSMPVTPSRASTDRSRRGRRRASPPGRSTPPTRSTCATRKACRAARSTGRATR